MTRWIIASSMKGRWFVIAAAVGLIGLGTWQLRSMPVDSLPEFMPPTVEIQTEALGLSAPEVEQLITVPLEQDLLAGVPWLDTMRSASIPGLSSIELVFDPGTDLLRARQVVQERLTQAAGLPNVSGPPQMLQSTSSVGRIMMIRLSSATLDQRELSVEARWTIRPKLLGVQGVANVSIWGQRERQLQVQVDPARLRRQGLSLDSVIETTGNALWASPLTFLEASTPGTGGFIDTAQQRLGIQHLQPISTAGDLSEVPIDGPGGSTLRLGDVADVVEDHQPLIGDAIFTDGDPGLLLVVEKFPGTNTEEVTRGAEDAIDALRPGLPGITIDTSVYRPATSIERGTRNLATDAAIALLLVVVALGLLRSEWRSALASVVAIATSLSVAWLVLYLRGTDVNTMVLAGLVMALVVIVDDAVVDVGAAATRLRQRRLNGVEPDVGATIRDALGEMRSAIAYATLIGLAALIPLLFLHGQAAPFTPPIVLSFGLALLASVVVALIVTPALTMALLPGASPTRRDPPLTTWLARGFDRASAAMVGAPRRAYAGVALAVLVALLAVPLLRGTVLPSFRDGNVLIDLRAVPGTSLPEMDRITSRIGRELATVPGVADVGADIGRAISSDRVENVDAAQLWLSVDPASDYDATLTSIRGVVDGYPGIANTVRTYSDERIAQEVARSDSPITVRVYGQSLDELRTQAQHVIDELSTIPGIVRPTVQLPPEEPTVDVTVDLGQAERFGVVPGDVRRAAATLMSGIGVGSLFEQQKVFDVVVWGTPDTRNSLDGVRNLLLDTPGGGHVRLGRVATVAVASTPTVIRHQDLSRNLDVTAGVQGRGVGDVATDVRAALAGLTFPLEYHAELVGDTAEKGSATQRAIAIAISAAIAIFLLLQAAFGSWRLAAVSFLVLPLAVAGALLAALVTDPVFSLGSIAGCLAVLVLSMRFGVTLLRHCQRLRSAQGTLDEALVRTAARDRFEPIVTTTVVAVLALLPFALTGNEAGQEVVRPMATAIVGGTLVAALLNLFVTPALYLRFAPATPQAPVTSDVVRVPEIEHAAER